MTNAEILRTATEQHAIDVQLALQTHNDSEFMKGILIRRGEA
jgi:hypothetical protein